MAVTIVGIDLGQSADHTAIAAISQQPLPSDSVPRDAFSVALGWQEPPKTITHYLLRAVKRVELGTAYKAISAELTLIATRLYNRDPEGEHYVVVDATGVGRPVVEMIRDQMIPQVHVTAVTFTSTDRCEGSVLARNECKVGKVYLARRLQVLAQGRRLHFAADDPLARVIVKEMQDYEVRVTAAAHLQYGAMKRGTHDDVLTAIGLACLADRQEEVTYSAPPY